MTRQHKRRIEWEAAQSENQGSDAQDQADKKGLPGQGGEELRTLLLEKTRLQQHLQAHARRPVQVTVDALGDQWIYVVRGTKPPMGWWDGYPVFWVDARPVAALG